MVSAYAELYLTMPAMKTKVLTPSSRASLQAACATVLWDSLSCVAFASDASFYRLVPQAVARPQNLSEVKALFAWSQAEGIPLVFRAGGTSLSGQAITDGVLVDVSRYWRAFSATEVAGVPGALVSAQPGVVGGHLNAYLQGFGRKIGPDPASIQSCMLGGIVANNASGMCCGVEQNTYHTLDSLVFMLPDGTSYDTARAEDAHRFQQEQKALCDTLLHLRQRLLKNPPLLERVRRKYRQKNTTGYSLNALVDFADPFAMFRHLLVGSEGTLAFVAEARLRTCAVGAFRSTGLLLFSTVEAACEALDSLRPHCDALELMDACSLDSLPPEALIHWWPDWLPLRLHHAPCALLIESQASTEAALQERLGVLGPLIEKLTLLQPARLTRDPDAQAALWKLRKGLYPSVGAARQQGTAVIIEDVVFPPEHLAAGIADLQALFQKHGYTPANGTGGIIFGHAMDANVHFVLTQGFDEPQDIQRYDAFMQDLVALVLSFEGALKAEHGTGRNVAPFVEAEWGPEALAMMQALKAAVDPLGLLNPGVILSENPQSHLQHLKALPKIDPEVDRCTECGFCEPVCPSRRLTLTPRQRIVLRRERARLQQAGQTRALQELDKAYVYAGLETCATDSLCASACPVGIDTGALVKRLRHEAHGPMLQRQVKGAAHQFAQLESGMRWALRLGHWGETVGAGKALNFALDQWAALTHKALPRWHKDLPPANGKPLPLQQPASPDFVYFPSCLSRGLGYAGAEPLPQVVMDLAQRAGIRLRLPAEVNGHCCGLPFGSKGFRAADEVALQASLDMLWKVSDQGRLSVIMDTSPCTQHLQSHLEQRGIRVLDFVAFASQHLLPRLDLQPVYEHVYAYPVCSVQKMGLAPDFVKVVQQCAQAVSQPLMATCCGTAGDRGLMYPDLTEAALQDVQRQLHAEPVDVVCASSRSCEMGMDLHLPQKSVSLAHLLWAAVQNTPKQINTERAREQP